MKPEINARLEHVTRKADRRKPEAGKPVDPAFLEECRQIYLRDPHLELNAAHAQTLATALEHGLYRLEAEEKTLLAFPVRQPYLLDAVRAEIRRSHELLNATRACLKAEAAGALRAGETP